jgi:hypothetical protein
MRVTFFWSNGIHQQQYDRRLVQFNTTTTAAGDVLHAPPRAFIYEHFKQAVLANMKGAGRTPNLDFDKDEDAQNMAVFESGEGKEWLETALADKLLYEDEGEESDSSGTVAGEKYHCGG